MLRPGDSVTGSASRFASFAQQVDGTLGSFSIASYLPDDVAVFNINGVSRPLSRYYGSLAAAQADYPHATSLSNETAWAALQAAINAASAAGGGRAIVPPGQFYMGGAQLTLPAMSAGDDGNNAVSLFGSGLQMTQLYWSVDAGAGTFAIALTSRHDYSRVVIEGLTLNGPATGSMVMGAARCAMSGIAMSSKWIVRDCVVENFYAAIDLQDDHIRISDSYIGRGCYYGLYYSVADVDTIFGDHFVERSFISGYTRAAVGIYPNNRLSDSLFLDVFCGNGPYVFYEEAGSHGISGSGALTTCSFIKTTGEGTGNAWFYSANSDTQLNQCWFYNFGVSYSDNFKITAEARRFCKVNQVSQCVFEGPHSSALTPTSWNLAAALFDATYFVSNLFIVDYENILADVSTTHPFTSASTCTNNHFTGGNYDAIPLKVSGSVSASNVLGSNGTGAKAMAAGTAPVGVAMGSYTDGQICPVITRGPATVNKVTGAISADDILVTDETTYGSVLTGSAPSTKSIVGLALAAALSGDATASINVDIYRYLARS